MGAPTPSRERRILRAGHSSIAVTLPKPWAEAMNLRPGDLVVFDQNDDGTLYLKPAAAPGGSAPASSLLLRARAFDTPGLLSRLVEGAYRVGHEAIEIRTDTPLGPDQIEELQAAARGLLGVSIVAQEPGRVLLQNFIDPSKYGLPQLVQRMKMILVALLEEAAASRSDRKGARRLSSIDEEAGRVVALLVRQLFLASRDWSLARRIGSPDPRQLLEWRIVVHALEELTTELRASAGTGKPARGKAKAPAWTEFLPLLEVGLRGTVEALMRPELPLACGAYGEALRLQREIAEARLDPRKASDPQLQAAARAATCLTTLAEVAVDRAVAGVSEAVFLESP
jgi:AbrB family looped-hinge helix DNA binding protein